MDNIRRCPLRRTYSSPAILSMPQSTTPAPESSAGQARLVCPFFNSWLGASPLRAASLAMWDFQVSGRRMAPAYLPSITRNRGGVAASRGLAGGVRVAVDRAELRGRRGAARRSRPGPRRSRASAARGSAPWLGSTGVTATSSIAKASGAAKSSPSPEVQPITRLMSPKSLAQRHHQHGGVVGAGAVRRRELELDDRGLVHHDVEQPVEADAVGLVDQERRAACRAPPCPSSRRSSCRRGGCACCRARASR